MEEQNEQMTTENKQRKTFDSEKFIISAPLFATAQVDDFTPPRKISFDCGKCDKETTWERVYNPGPASGNDDNGNVQVPDWGVKSVAYKCLLCGDGTFTVFYREMGHGEKAILPRPGTGLHRSTAIPNPVSSIRIVTAIMKVGQYPEPTISLPEGLRKALGSDAANLYRKALVSRNNGFGLAAVGYMRRVVEDKTNELIGIAAQYAEANGADADTVSKIRAAVDANGFTPYANKLKLAADVFPSSLIVGNINPLRMLHGDVSKALHGLDEESCISIADELKTIFEYVFEELKARLEKEQAFRDRVRKRA